MQMFYVPDFAPSAHPHHPQQLLQNIRNVRWRAQKRDNVQKEEAAVSERAIAIAASER